jgi:hypothetical protein
MAEIKPAQLDVFGNAPDPDGLTAIQRAAFELVRSSPGGVTADEVGAHRHADRGRHPADQRCDWCTETGTGILRSAKLAPLVIRRRGGMWQIRDPRDAVHTVPDRSEPTEAELALNPFAGL